jgi:signal transduction histidine kinase
LRVRQERARYAAVLAERGRIAREIHDGLTHGLVAVSTRLECLAFDLAQPHPTASALAAEVELARQAAAATLAEARDSVHQLRPRSLDGADLVTALRQVTRVLSARTRVELEVGGTVRPLAPGTEDTLFRIAQEAATNAVRHAEASGVTVRLEFRRRSVHLSIRDDGRGLTDTTSAVPRHHGLEGMRARAEEIGSRLVVISAPGGGTEISVEVQT